MRRDRAFAQDHFLCIDVVVDRMKHLIRFQPCTVKDILCHPFPVPACKALTQLYVMQIILQRDSGQPAKVFRYRCFAGLIRGFQRLQRRLNFSAASRFAIRLDQLLPPRRQIIGAFSLPHRVLLVQLCRLLSKISASGMDHQIIASILSAIHFNKMVAPAQRSQ